MIKITHKSTCCYCIKSNSGLLAFDALWPDSYKAYKDGLREHGQSVKNIGWLIVSHFHIDHAGLAGIFVNNGVQLIVFTNQLAAMSDMEKFIERKEITYQKIDQSKIILKEVTQSRQWLQEIGVMGEILQTNGHSEDSISLILDTGEAFIGDLVPAEDMIGEDDWKSKNSWKLLKDKGVRYIKPAHAEEFTLF